MSEMEDKLNTLSPEELNALNSDPQLLNSFKEKYGTHGHSTLQKVWSTVKGAAQVFLNGSQQDPTNQVVQAGANQTGEDIATSKFGQANPELAAGIGTAVQMSPDIAAMAIGTGESRGAAKAGELGMAGRVVSGPARAEAGQAIGAAEQAAGVHADIVPTIKDVTANLGLKNANAKQYLNALMERLKSGEPMSAEALSQHHKMITDLLSNEPTGIGKMLGGASKLGTSGVSTAAKADAMLVEQLNAAAPGRAEGAANYAASKIRGNIYKGTAGVAAAAIGRNAIMDAFNRLAGGK